MINLRLCNAATILYSILKFWHMHLCGKGYKYFSPHCCKYNSFGCIAAIRCDNVCPGPHNDSVYSGSEHPKFNSPRLIKREAGFPNPRRALLGSNQLWRVNDSPYYREYNFLHAKPWISPWIKSISNELYIIIHLIASQLSGHFDVNSNRLWRHQQNENRVCETRGRCDKIIVFIVIYGFVMSCKKWNNVCTLVTNCFCTHSSVILVFIE